VRACLAVLTLVLLCAGCSKSPTTPTSTNTTSNPSNASSSLTATIDGVPFVGVTVTATYHAGADFQTLLVNAQDASQNLLSFDVGPAPKTAFAAGTYALGANGSNAVYNPFPTTANTGFNLTNGPQTGSVVVTAFSAASKTASGTFSFVLHNGAASKTIANGVFSVTFP
jgi:hypothetical protein